MRALALLVMLVGAMLMFIGIARLRRPRLPPRREPDKPVEFAIEFAVAPILALDDVAHRQPYRSADDPEWIVRFRSEQPEKLRRRVAEEISVAGLARDQLHAWLFIAGRDQRLELERAPDAIPGYPDAIRVWGAWIDAEGEHREALGWVPVAVALRIARDPDAFELAAVPRLFVLPLDGRIPEVRFDVWTHLESKRR